MADQSTDDTTDTADEQPTTVSELPTHKADLVALAIDHGVPSYQAWAMTVPELTKRLEA
jgi:hypothetical protein